MNVKVKREYDNTIKNVYGNKGELSQVFLNILLNASQAMKGKTGTITVRTGMDGEDYVVVEFADTGCGVPDEIKDRIFEPFFTTKKVGEGTGLGLSIAHQIVEKHAGTVTFESRVDEGTKFFLRLPCSK